MTGISPRSPAGAQATTSLSGAAPGGHTGPARRRPSLGARVLARPEIGAACAAFAIFAFFFVAAPSFRTGEAMSTILYSASTIGIVALGVALLMIGGEFDLSSGVAVTTAALTSALVSYELSLNVWVGAAASLVVALGVGFVNGALLQRTGLPSFLVTLATFFALQGINLGVTKMLTGTVATDSIEDMDGFASAHAVFAGEISLGIVDVNVSVVWWLLFVAVASWILLRARTGNWILAVGGGEMSARAVGVPVARVKTGLYMGVAFLAWFLGQHLLLNFSTVQAGLGVGNELIYIVAAVVGGALLTGGYGSALGSAFGALIFGMTTQGIVFAGWDPNWFKTFLGAMLLLAVLLNLSVNTTVAMRR